MSTLKYIRVLPVFLVIAVVGLVLWNTPQTNLAVDTTQSALLSDSGPPKYIRVMLNDQPLYSPALARIIGTHSLVPLRPVAEAAGARVDWNKETNTVNVVFKEKTVKMTMDKTKAFVDDQAVNLDVAPQYTDGAVLVPVSLIMQPLELNIVWDSRIRTLNIFTANFMPSSPPAKSSQAEAVPIIMYHELGDGPNSLYVRDSEFQEQMRYLKENNYRVVSLSKALRMMRNHESMSKVVVITFDDGYVSFYTKAWPILRQYHFPATVFVIAHFAGVPNYLTWEQMAMMQAGWIEIGSHSETHPSLSKISSERYTEEIVGSKKLIEDCLQVPCEVFCYPGGDYNTAVVNTVKNAGYTAAVTTVYGKASLKNDPYQLLRIRIPRGMSLQAFAKSL